jgi:hypothetical protein
LLVTIPPLQISNNVAKATSQANRLSRRPDNFDLFRTVEQPD